MQWQWDFLVFCSCSEISEILYINIFYGTYTVSFGWKMIYKSIKHCWISPESVRASERAFESDWRWGASSPSSSPSSSSLSLSLSPSVKWKVPTFQGQTNEKSQQKQSYEEIKNEAFNSFGHVGRDHRPDQRHLRQHGDLQQQRQSQEQVSVLDDSGSHICRRRARQTPSSSRSSRRRRRCRRWSGSTGLVEDVAALVWGPEAAPEPAPVPVHQQQSGDLPKDRFNWYPDHGEHYFTPLIA